MTSCTHCQAQWQTTPGLIISFSVFCLMCRTGVFWTQLLWTTLSLGRLFWFTIDVDCHPQPSFPRQKSTYNLHISYAIVTILHNAHDIACNYVISYSILYCILSRIWYYTSTHNIICHENLDLTVTCPSRPGKWLVLTIPGRDRAVVPSSTKLNIDIWCCM